MSDKKDLSPELSNYLIIIQGALMNYQHIEELLKMYLDSCFVLINISLDKKIPFKYTRESINNYSLERLLNLFRMYNSNISLIEKLTKIIDNRNWCAHKSFLISTHEMRDDEHLKKEAKKVITLIDDALECFHELRNEVDSVIKITKNVT